MVLDIIAYFILGINISVIIYKIATDKDMRLFTMIALLTATFVFGTAWAVVRVLEIING